MRCAVVGDPIDHSLSPALHRAGYAACELDWQYDAHRVPAGTLAEFVAGLLPHHVGLSVTAPLKREALALAVRASDIAVLAGAANTLARGDGGWVADNTDVGGAVAALAERGCRRVSSGTVIGGGATAASTGLALAELGAERIRLLVRTPANAEAAATAVRSHPAHPEVEVHPLEAPMLGDVVVSTIPASAQDPALSARMADVPVVFDVLYDPWPTPFARAATGVVVGGLDLLVHQAAEQFRIFTGRAAPLAGMRAAGEQALAARRS